jgi:hypothetical protein
MDYVRCSSGVAQGREYPLRQACEMAAAHHHDDIT